MPLQVTEHMNKVVKRYFRDHTNDRVAVENITNNKFSQVLSRLAVLSLRKDEIRRPVLKAPEACPTCIRAGRAVTEVNWHCRVTSKLCPDYVPKQGVKRGRALMEATEADSTPESDGG